MILCVLAGCLIVVYLIVDMVRYRQRGPRVPIRASHRPPVFLF